jgi:hypothetical protein
MPKPLAKTKRAIANYSNKVTPISLSLPLICLFIALQDFLNWPLLQFARVVHTEKFRDSLWILQDADCYQTIGNDIYNLASVTGCPAYIYGEPLLWILNILRIGPEDTEIFVHGMRFLFSLAVAHILKILFVKISKVLLVALLILISPGVQLMLYNGNIDLLIFAIVSGSYFAFKSNRTILGFILIAFTGVIKFYTIPLFIIAFFIPLNKRNKIISLFLFLITAGSAFRDLIRMKEEIPSTGYAQFGMSIFPKYLTAIGYDVSPDLGHLISILIFAGCVIIFYATFARYANQKLFIESKIQLAFLMLSVVLLACFLTGLSYDPRLIYLTISGAIVFFWIPKTIFRNLYLIFLLSASLLSCGIELGLIPTAHEGFHVLRVIQLVNDITIEISVALVLVYLLKLPIVRTRLVQGKDIFDQFRIRRHD